MAEDEQIAFYMKRAQRSGKLRAQGTFPLRDCTRSWHATSNERQPRQLRKICLAKPIRRCTSIRRNRNRILTASKSIIARAASTCGSQAL